MSMTLSGSDLQGDCPDHTQTYCYGCKSAYTHSASLHKYIQCKHTSTHSASSARYVLHIHTHTALITHCLVGTCTSSLFELLFTGALLFKAALS